MSQLTTTDENDERFDTQTFLLAYYDQIAKEIKEKQTFKHIYILETEQDYPTTKVVSALTNKTIGTKQFTKLRTHQYNSLIPKITLFRVDQAKDGKIIEREFLFPKDTRTSNIFLERSAAFIKGNNCGIKNIKWEIAGTDPVSAEKTISATIDFYFDSVNSFSGGAFEALKAAYLSGNDLTSQEFADFNRGTTTTNYWSLIFHPNYTKKNNGISNQEETPNDYDTTKFRIKCVVGWNDLDPNIRNELFNKREDSNTVSNIDEVITNLTTSMYLNLIKHEFKFNEDGSLMLTATYVASLENSLRSDKLELLGGLKKVLSDLKFASGTDLTNGVDVYDINEILNNSKAVSPALLDAITIQALDAASSVNDIQLPQVANQTIFASSAEELRKSIEFISNIEKLKGCSGLPSELTTLINSSDQKKLQEDLIKQLDTITQIIEKQKEIRKKEYYGKLLTKLFENKNSNIFTVKISQQQANEFTRWTKNPINLTRLPFDQTITKSTDAVVNGRIEDLVKKLSNNTELSDITNDLTKDSNIDTVSKPIYFTTIGSLIDSALEVVKDSVGADTAEFNRFKILLGNFSSEAPLFQATNANLQNVSKNLAYLPIDIDRFLLFYTKEVIEKTVDSYPFFAFLKNLINSLIYSSLNADFIDNKEVNKYADVSLAGVVINLGNTKQNSEGTYLDNVVGDKSKRIIQSNSVTEESLKPYYIKNTKNSNHLDYTCIYFLFDKYQKDFSGNGKEDEDEKKGIFHYTVAQDYGLIKSINFKRIDQPFLKEAKSVGRKTFFLGQFRDIYNVELKMIGNNIYYPGMMLHVKPSIEFGPPAKPNSFSQITGIGGYFQVIKVSNIITEDMYETVLDCVYQSSGGENLNSSKEPCEIFGASNISSETFLLPTMNAIISTYEEIKKLEEEKSRYEIFRPIGYFLNIGSTAEGKQQEDFEQATRKIDEINKVLKPKYDKISTLYSTIKSNPNTSINDPNNSALSLIDDAIGKEELERILSSPTQVPQ